VFEELERPFMERAAKASVTEPGIREAAVLARLGCGDAAEAELREDSVGRFWRIKSYCSSVMASRSARASSSCCMLGHGLPVTLVGNTVHS
jgi:hypothetical protein